MIRSDSYSIVEICRSVGISKDTFYTWIREKPDFSDAVEKARKEFEDAILAECNKSLVNLIRGFDSKETKETWITAKDPKTGKRVKRLKEEITTTKHVGPNLGAIIHYQTNRDPERWANRQRMELTGKDGRELFNKLTDAELDARIREFEKNHAECGAPGSDPLDLPG